MSTPRQLLNQDSSESEADDDANSTASEEDIDHHKKILACIKAFSIKTDEAGVCAGFSYQTRDAFLSNNMPAFNGQIEWLEEQVELSRAIKTTLRKSPTDLNDEDREILHFKTFLQSVANYNEGSLDRKKLQAADTQHALADDLIAAYTSQEVTIYFQTLREALSSFPHPVSLVLGCGDHALMVGFDPSKQLWILSNVDNLPILEDRDDAQIARDVQTAFGPYATSNIFSSEIYVTKEHEEAVKPCIAHWHSMPEWQAMHAITQAKAISMNAEDITWLYIAAMRNETNMVHELLLQNANPNQASKETGTTPVHIAAQYGYVNCLQLMQAKGANLEAKQKDTATPLFLAAQFGHTNVVDFLITQKVNVTEARDDGTSPLAIASQEGHYEVVNLLLQNGAAPNQRCDDGTTALKLAAGNGHTNIVQLLLSFQADPNIPGTKQATALHIAVEDENLELTRLLLQNQANPNIANAEGESPLHKAALLGNNEIILELLRNKANPFTKTNRDKLAITLAHECGHQASVALLNTIMRKLAQSIATNANTVFAQPPQKGNTLQTKREAEPDNSPGKRLKSS